MADSDGIISHFDASTIGHKIVEMADRAKVAHKWMPGTEANWAFEMDDVRYKVTVVVETKKEATT